MGDLGALSALLTAQGWTMTTAVCTLLFSLFHWPCSTTCLTIYKETGSAKWTALAVALPTALGLVLCFVVATTAGCWASDQKSWVSGERQSFKND